MGIFDAMTPLKDWETKGLLFGEAKKKYSRYMEVRDRLKRQPLTNAERKAVETAHFRYS